MKHLAAKEPDKSQELAETKTEIKGEWNLNLDWVGCYVSAENAMRAL